MDSILLYIVTLMSYSSLCPELISGLKDLPLLRQSKAMLTPSLHSWRRQALKKPVLSLGLAQQKNPIEVQSNFSGWSLAMLICQAVRKKYLGEQKVSPEKRWEDLPPPHFSSKGRVACPHLLISVYRSNRRYCLFQYILPCTLRLSWQLFSQPEHSNTRV